MGWATGDVFVGVGSGSYKVYSNTGAFKDTITTSTDLTTGCAFNSLFDIYTTNTTNTKVFKFDGDAPHAVLQTIDTNAQSPAGHSQSIVFDAAGNFYVGHADSDDVLKYNAAGNFLTRFDVPIDLSGSDWIDLSTDQKTLFYTSEGTLVKRFDLAANAPLGNFSTALTKAFALRLLGPSFNGSNGLIVANDTNIRRLNASGAIVQTYDTGGQQEWHTIALDPNGTSFWAGDFKSGKIYKFNFSSSSPVLGPISTGANRTLNGICVLGQQQLQIVPLVFDPGSKVKRTASFGNPVDKSFNAWTATYDGVNTKFINVISHTLGVDPSRFDPTFLDASPIPYFDAGFNDGQTGSPVVYRELSPPALGTVTGLMDVYVGFHPPGANDYTPPSCAGTTGNARLLVDPDDDTLVPTALKGDFIFDMTLFVNPFGQLFDPISGSKRTKTCDYVVADRCTTVEGATAFFSSPANGSNVQGGSNISLRLEVPGVSNANDFPNDITLTVSDPQGEIIQAFDSPGNSPSIFDDKGNFKYGAGVDTNNFVNGVHHICATSIDESGAAVGQSTGAGQFGPTCIAVNIVNSNVQ